MLDIFKNASGSVKYCIVTPAILAILYLVSIAKLEYGYYTFVRIFSLIALGAFLFMYWTASSTENKSFLSFPTITATVILILFNPILPLEFSKQVWTVLDVLSAIAMISISVFVFREHEKTVLELERKERLQRERAKRERERVQEDKMLEILKKWKYSLPEEPTDCPVPEDQLNYIKTNGTIDDDEDLYFGPFEYSGEYIHLMHSFATAEIHHELINVYVQSRKRVAKVFEECMIMKYCSSLNDENIKVLKASGADDLEEFCDICADRYSDLRNYILFYKRLESELLELDDIKQIERDTNAKYSQQFHALLYRVFQ